MLERRHVLGGAAVTEEIVPGFKFSRASYLVSLLRPQIVKDLELKVQFSLFNFTQLGTCMNKFVHAIQKILMVDSFILIFDTIF